ncbi:hypothetical protein ACFOYU_11235 [Microvirga sp. GCM10011540]|uniref:hypothetical protein n=1 Tax=Microvirga sp. GCM10011540 TaxID=3317338 RepID=UPI00360B1644
MSVYSAGAVSVTAGDVRVFGTLTIFRSQAADGDIFAHAGYIGIISEIVSNTELRLLHPWEGPDAVQSSDYGIVHVGNRWLSNVTVNEQLTSIIQKIEAGIGFKPDASGTLAERSNFDTASKNFIFMRTDSNPFLIYVKNSASPGDWSQGTSFTGPAGPPGGPGPTGAPGPATNIAIGSVTSGPTPVATITGTAPNLILNLTLPLGPEGPEGPEGPQGPPVSLAIGSVTHGETASATITGTSPDLVLDLVLPQGEQGIQGIQGEIGPANALTVGTVEASEPGSVPQITITGAAPNQTIHFVIPRGEQGPQGQQGIQGDPGPANTLTIGTVTTGAAGSAVTATLTGTAPNQVLNLSIPRGDQGQVGPQGEPGRLAEFRGDMTSGTIQWRLVGDPTWATLVSFGDIQAASHTHPDLEAKIAAIPDPIAMAIIFAS